MPEDRKLFHVLLALPEDAVDALVGSEEGDERDMVCLEDDPEQCHRPALSLLISAADEDEARQFALTIAREYGADDSVWTVPTDISEVAAKVHKPGVLWEGDCLFAVNDDEKVLERTAKFMISSILQIEDEEGQE